MSSVEPPPIRFPDAVRRDLEAHRRGLADETERTMAAHARPCVAITAQRVADTPLRPSVLGRLFGGRGATPTLGVLESKFGGAPYCESAEEWDAHSFLGQIDLARATSVLPAHVGKLGGLLRIDFRAGDLSGDAFRVRWFPHASPDRAVPATPRSVGRWETRLDFALAWTLPEGNELEAIWPIREPGWFEYDRFYPAGYNEDGFDEFHRLLGHKSAGLDEHYGFVPPAGCVEDLSAYESLLRITFDRVAGFAWGTNWIYLLVPRDDLARGDLRRIVATGANG